MKKMKNVLFISTNENKVKEMKRIFEELNLEISIQGYGNINKVVEIQTDNLETLVIDKLKRIYEQVKRPVIVEHTVLKIAALKGYPYTETQLFWDKFQAEGILELISHYEDRAAEAETVIAYCDGKNIVIGNGCTNGRISEEVKGESKFQWDTIFVPEGSNSTFAELEAKEEKDNYSMRRKAVEDLNRKINELYIKQQIEASDNELYEIGLDPKIIAEIAIQIKKRRLILFIGAGISSSVSLPSWNNLINELGGKLGYEPEVFKMLGDNIELSEYYGLKQEKCLENIKKYFDSIVGIEVEQKVKESKIYEAITKLGVDRIYTTNFESLIEDAYKIHYPAQAIHTIYDLKSLNDSKEGAVEIIKLHGDLKVVDDMVLTQSSYFKRYDFENSLDILLRSDLLNKSVLFIGYSFNDYNLKYMFHKLNSLWSREEIGNRPKSYIFLTENNPVQRTLMKENYNMESIVTDDLDKSKAVEKFLSDILCNLRWIRV
ncbi:MAG: hypothetical protein K0S71_43 [Clostridia bacterium]|jgi:non-canonical purine NTP pyrophosphatase (RdgB/HAM1 family)|nr:hypothetical protein [Clostridia bacterium]